MLSLRAARLSLLGPVPKLVDAAGGDASNLPLVRNKVLEVGETLLLLKRRGVGRVVALAPVEVGERGAWALNSAFLMKSTIYSKLLRINKANTRKAISLYITCEKCEKISPAIGHFRASRTCTSETLGSSLDSSLRLLSQLSNGSSSLRLGKLGISVQ